MHAGDFQRRRLLFTFLAIFAASVNVDVFP